MRNNFKVAVDQLGDIREQIKALQEKEVALKAIIAEQGVGIYEGDNYLAEVLKHGRDNLDMAAVRAKLTPQFIAAHTVTTQVTTVKCKRIESRFAPIDVKGFESTKTGIRR